MKLSLAWVGLLLIGLLLIGLLLLTGYIPMSPTELTPNYPHRVRFSTERPDVFYERSNAYALHYSQPDSAPREADHILEDGTIAIFPRETVLCHHSPDTAISPVYTLAPGQVLAVPTGRLFVRFTQDTIATDHAPALQAAGYAIESSSTYAPHTAWVQARSGDIAEALSNIPQLEAIAAIENVEPQMIVERQLKSRESGVGSET
ncbi:hypothetical protein [Egbenema bharatensis]|uniref:hypothetical protein n=1 Tax=Egbenema bharatensis TaxID=3463334 RepID=UPI003A879FFF